MRPVSPRGPAGALSICVSVHVVPARSARNTRPFVVPMKRRPGEANASANTFSPESTGSAIESFCFHDRAKSRDTKTVDPAPTATTFASAGCAGLNGVPTMGCVIVAHGKSHDAAHESSEAPPVSERYTVPLAKVRTWLGSAQLMRQ